MTILKKLKLILKKSLMGHSMNVFKKFELDQEIIKVWEMKVFKED